MDDRHARRSAGALRHRVFSVVVAVSVVVATGTIPASAAVVEPAGVAVAVAQPAAAHEAPVTVQSLRTVRAVHRAAATVLADAAVAEAAVRGDAARQAEAAHAAQAAQDAEAAEADRVAAEAAEAAQTAATVTEVQQALLTLGYQGVGRADGVAGARTASAIEEFQADAGYPVTGAASAQTLTELTEKVDAGWRRPVPAAPARPSAKPSAPAGATVPAVSAPPAPAVVPAAWTTYVANSGNQASIDLCAGGLTSFRGDDGNPYFSVPYLTIHNNCGGAPILDLRAGDVVAITGGGVEGRYEVVDSRDVSQGATTSAVAGLAGDIYLQTCYFNSTTMRIVGAVKVS